MRGLILVLMSNVCNLAVILIFFEVIWWLLLVTQWLLLVYWLLLVTWWLLLVPNFSMNALKSVLLNLKILCLQFHLFYFRYFNCAQNILSRIQFKEFKRGSVTSSPLECYLFTQFQQCQSFPHARLINTWEMSGKIAKDYCRINNISHSCQNLL